jgi:arylsulfatase A-like enzyme
MLMVITGDHGEAFWEHEAFGHGAALVDEETRTAFYLCGPEPLSTRYQVGSHADVMPTVFSLIGLPPPFAGWTNGKSLTGYEPSLDMALVSPAGTQSRHHRIVTTRGGATCGDDDAAMQALWRTDEGEYSLEELVGMANFAKILR